MLFICLVLSETLPYLTFGVGAKHTSAEASVRQVIMINWKRLALSVAMWIKVQ